MQSSQSQLKLKIWQGSKKNYDRLLTYKELEVGTIYFVGDDATFGTSKTGIIYIAVSKEKAVLFGAFDMAQLSQKVDEIERLLDEANGDIDRLIADVSRNTEKLATIEEGAEKNKINAIELNGQAITPSEDKVINILIPIKTSELTNDSEYQTSADVAETIIGVDLNIANGIITLTRKNGTTFTIDLPTEKITKSGYYDSETEEIVMVLADDSEIRFSASQLINEYYADNVTLEQYTDTADANKKKFRLTTSYKNKVDGAEQASNKTASVTSASTATQYPSALAVWNAIKNFATSVQIFTTASTRANIESGETISTIFGKIRKWFADLKAVAFSGSYNDLSEIPSDIVKAKSPTIYQCTIEELWIELSGKTGSMGSVYLKPSASGAGSIISETWYNYIHIPHRTGIGLDNHLYAHILLFPMMNLGIANLDVSISNGSILGIKKFSNFQFSDISGSIEMDRVANLTSALNQKLTKNVGWFASDQSIPYWYKIAEYICYEGWFDLNSTFIASKNFYGAQGILVSSIRTNNSGTVEVCDLHSMVYEDAFSPANFAIAYKETKGSNVVFQIWGKCPSIYNGGSIMLLYNGVRSIIPQNQFDYWNFFNQDESSTNKVAVNSDGSFTLSGFTVKICRIANINNLNTTYRKLKDVLEITDSNLATYYNSNTEVLSGISNTIGTILINCSSRIKISAIQMTDVFNGKRVSLIGDFVPSERYSSYNNTVSGGFSSYLYTHRPGSPNSSLGNDTVIRGYEDFIYFNGKWYGKGY